MAERFQRLYTLEPNLYTERCPIIIEAGALLKDTESGAILAQIKMRNIGEAIISSCRISIKAYATNGDEVKGVTDFSYLDLNATCGSEFGTKVPVMLPDRTARSFAVDINEIVYSDGTVEKTSSNYWRTVPKQKTIDEIYQNPELIKQFKKEVGGQAVYLPEKKDGFFLCTCGAINLESSETCYRCGNSFNMLRDCLDKDFLLGRIDEENRKAEIEEEKNKKKKKLLIKIAVAAVAALIVVVIAYSIHQKNEAKKEAEICASLAGKSYTAVVDTWGERHLSFHSDGTVSYYDKNSEPGYWDDDVYGVKKIGDNQYALDRAMTEDTLFYNGEYEYVVTGIEGTQITEFTDVDEFAGYDIYKLDSTQPVESSSVQEDDQSTEQDSNQNSELDIEGLWDYLGLILYSSDPPDNLQEVSAGNWEYAFSVKYDENGTVVEYTDEEWDGMIINLQDDGNGSVVCSGKEYSCIWSIFDGRISFGQYDSFKGGGIALDELIIGTDYSWENDVVFNEDSDGPKSVVRVFERK